MNIALSGPKMYDFQDKVCVAFMLDFYEHDKANFFSERKGSEDGTLHLNDQNNTIIEIQVKGANKPIDLDFVVECLVHMPDRESKDTLLEKLVGNEHLYVVLVMSGRCEDATKMYLAPWTRYIEPHKKGCVKLRDAEVLLTNISDAKIYRAKAKDAPKNIKADRAQHCKTLAGTLDKKRLTEALHRLIILEKIDSNEIISICSDKLQKTFHIPQDKHERVISELHDIVKTSKNEGTDAFPGSRIIVEGHRPEPLFSCEYVGRGDEDQYRSILDRDNVLLLSGLPRTGKTYLARSIGLGYRDIGYNVDITDDIEDADRFLSHVSAFPRLVILDDPFGSTHLVDKPVEVLTRLKSLVMWLSSHRKLIVVQSENQLLETVKKEDIKQISINNYKFTTIANYPKGFLFDLWISIWWK